MEEIKDTHLDKYFEKIDKSYLELSDGKDLPVDTFKGRANPVFEKFIASKTDIYGLLATDIWKMLEKSKFHNLRDELSVQIMEGIKYCVKTYKATGENSHFSKFVYSHLEEFVFKKNPYANKAGIVTNDLGSFSISKKDLEKIRHIQSFIDDYEQLYSKKVESSNEKVINWIITQTDYERDFVIAAINILNTSRYELNAENEDSDESKRDVAGNYRTQLDLLLIKEKIAAYIKKAENLWNKKQPEKKKQISVLFTWRLFNEISFLTEDELKDILSSFAIIDKKILNDFFSGAYEDDSSQKRIAKELGISVSLASKTLKERFLEVLEKEIGNIDL